MAESDNVVDDSAAGPEQPSVAFSHPLHGAMRSDGTIPAVTILDSPGGKRYAIAETITSHEEDEGRPVIESGVVELELTHETVAQEPPPAVPPSPVLSGGLQFQAELAAEQGDRAQTEVIVRLRRPEVPALFVQLEARIAEGMIEDTVDLEAERAELLARHAEVIESLQEDAEATAERLGGKILYSCTTNPCFVADMPIAMLRDLAEHPDVVRITEVTVAAEEAQNWNLLRGSQGDQYIYDGWEGQGGTLSDPIPVGVFEAFEINDEHRVFWDDDDGPARILARYDCDNEPNCTLVANFAGTPSDHATGVAAIILGDLTEGQHPSYAGANTAAQKDRSGFAREAKVLAFAGNNSSEFLLMVDRVLGLTSNRPKIVNMSMGWGQWSDAGECLMDPVGTDYCNGDDAVSMAANDLYQGGILLIKSAGNDAVACGTSDCRVSVPGSAIGVFTVGGHGPAVSVNDATVQEVRTDSINGASNRGGTTSHLAWGKGRTIIDLTAFGLGRDLASGTGNGSFLLDLFGTSFAAPAVTGSAALFINHYQETFSTYVTDPGMIYANLLLMGDRQSVSGILGTEFSRDYGAGRLRLRMIDDDGMDNPWGYGNLSVCVGEGEVVSYSLNSGNALSSNVNDLKVVAYWFDSRHELGNYAANLDLRLRNLDTNSIIVASEHDYDNKERVFYSAAGSKRIAIEVVGVSGIDEGTTYHTCSTAGKVRVNVAWFYEDDARDDFFGPSWDAMSFVGVAPE